MVVTDCVLGLNDDVGFDCNVKPVAGLEQRVLMINWKDLDRNRTVWNETKTRITSLELLPDKRAYLFKGFKKLFNGGSKIKQRGFEHSLNLRFFHMDDNSINQINQAVKRGTYIAVVEVKAKGLNLQDSFEVLGYDCGLKAIDGQRTYNELDGTYVMNFATPSELIEPRSVYKWFENDYANTKFRFDNKLRSGNVIGDDFKIFNTVFNELFG